MKLGLYAVPMALAWATLASAQSPAFEVASVRENRSVNSRTLMDAAGGRYTVTNASLRILILNAFGLQDAQLVGAPGWISDTRYDIAAVRGAAPVEQIPAMMRQLLADRFKLKTHAETREMTMYALVMARADRRAGASLKAVSCEGRPLLPQAGTLPCNTRFIGPGRLRAGGLTMAEFAPLLTTLVDRIVIDRSGLDGRYDFDLTWTPEQPAKDAPVNDRLPAADTSGVSVFTALQEQLGLRLNGQRGPVDVLVVDNIERPTDN